MQPRIFLSHSTHETADKPILDHLRQLLEAHHFQVFVDEVSLEAGDLWRQKLLRGLGLCDGAVVLVNQRALEPGRKWVETEASILRWRKWNEPKLPLVIVRIGDVTPRLIAERWPALAFEDLQMLPKGAGRLTADGIPFAGEVFEGVLRALAPLRERLSSPGRLEQIRDAIAAALHSAVGDANGRYAEFAARDLGMAEELIDASPNVFVLLANLLVQEGPSGAWFQAVVDRLSDILYVKNQGDMLRRILDLSAPLWVNPAAVHRLARVQHLPAPRPVFRLNGVRPAFTGARYVQRACCKSPLHAWVCIEIQPKVGARAVRSVLDQVRAGLRAKIPGLSGAPDADLKTRLAQRKDPCFVILPPELADDERIIAAIRETFEELVLLCLTGFPSEPSRRPGVEDIAPPLAEGEEDQAFRNFLEAEELMPVIDPYRMLAHAI